MQAGPHDVDGGSSGGGQLESAGPAVVGIGASQSRRRHPAESTKALGTELADRAVTTLTYAVGEEVRAVASIFSL